MKRLEIKLFGALEVLGPDGNRISIPGSKQQALLACLALSLDYPPSRDRLIGLLWGDRFSDQARQSLRQGVSKLRQLLVVDGHHALVADNDRIGLDLNLISIDLAEFQALIREDDPTSDAAAVAMFQDTFLDGLFVREAAFEEWLSAERSRVNELGFPVFQRLSAHQLKIGEQAKSLETARRLLALDPLRESSHRLLMRILAQSGQRAAAIQQYQACSDILMRELEVAPDPETTRVLEEIKSPAPAPPVPVPEPTEIPDAMAARSEDSPQGSSKVTITTLPFQAIGGDEAILPYVEGLGEDITSALTKYRWLDVIAQMPESASETTVTGLRQTALKNGVLYSVEGSVRQLGADLRVTVQLVELDSGKYVWVQRFDYRVDAFMAAFNELSEAIAALVESELVGFEGTKARGVSSDAMGAWDCYHLGLSTQYEFSMEGNSRAQSLFRRAIDLDPGFAAAHARLSYAMVLSAIYFEADQNSGLLDQALELARTATRLDDQDAVARFALGRAHLARGEYDRSIMELEQAIELNPGLAQAHCGLGDSLAYMGKAADAIPQFEEAVRLSPHDPHRWAFSMYGSLAHIFSGDYEKAAEWALAAVRVPNSHFWSNAALVSALGHLGRDVEASEALKELLELKPNFDCEYVRDRLFYLNDEAQVERYIQGLLKAGLESAA